MIKVNVIKNKIKKLLKRIEDLKRFLFIRKNKKVFSKAYSNASNINLEKKNKDLKYSLFFLNGKEFKYQDLIGNINQLSKNLNDLLELIILSFKYDDIDSLSFFLEEIKIFEKKIYKLEFLKIFPDKIDFYNCYFDLKAGSGGIEAQDWARMLMRMYLRWIESKKFKSEIHNLSFGEKNGIKSATVRVIGKYAYGWLKTETGIHRLVRKSPFNSGGKRHTSFSSVFFYPEVDSKIDVKVNMSDLKIDFYRSSGAGGQHVNTTESAVRITHIPTGIIAKCQNNRSQHKNKNQALKQLKSRIFNLELEKKNSSKLNLEKEKSKITWGRQIRSYVLDNSRIKDLRTGIETRKVNLVLDGNLDEFINENLKLLR